MIPEDSPLRCPICKGIHLNGTRCPIKPKPKMTPEAQRIAIATELGEFSFEPEHDYVVIKRLGKTVMRYFPASSSELICECLEMADVPDYPRDLDACHEMEKLILDPDSELVWANHEERGEIKREYQTHLERIATLGGTSAICATAPQRCEAFLRAVGKWDDTK